MDKVITIPDSQVKDLKMQAIREEKSFKQFLEDLLQEAISNRKKNKK